VTQDWPRKNSHFPCWRFLQNSRKRSVLLFVLIYAFGGWKALKSDSAYPVTCVDAPAGMSTFIERRDVWAVIRNSEKRCLQKGIVKWNRSKTRAGLAANVRAAEDPGQVHPASGRKVDLPQFEGQRRLLLVFRRPARLRGCRRSNARSRLRHNRSCCSSHDQSGGGYRLSDSRTMQLRFKLGNPGLLRVKSCVLSV